MKHDRMLAGEERRKTRSVQKELDQERFLFGDS